MDKYLKYRKHLLKKYGHLYSKNYDLDQSKCCYCGVSQQCYDHKPALALMPYNSEKWIKDKKKFILVPSCKNCNSMLNSKDFEDIYDVLIYLQYKYVNKLLKSPIWTQDELNDMSDTMKSLILGKQSNRNELIDKIIKIKENILLYENLI